MIIQCEQCDTRFRMADEKLKPGGTKVRCSKCKFIFSVMPPAPEPAPEVEPIPTPTAPEPAPPEATEESVDFGSFNMEQVSDTEVASQPSAPALAATDESELDFSGLEGDMGSGTASGDELADDFSFVDTRPTSTEDDEPAAGIDPQEQSLEFELDSEPGSAAEMDFGAAFEETPEEAAATAPGALSGGPSFDETADSADLPAEEFSFGDEDATSTAETSGPGEFSLDEEPAATADESGPSEFSFDEETSAAALATGGETTEFAFGDADDTAALSFDDETTPAAATTDEFAFGDGATDEFSFNEEPGNGALATEWSDDGASDSSSFDFDEPQFETEAKPAKPADDLQFGEIDFAQDDDESPSFETPDDFAGASLAREEEPAVELSPPPSQRQRAEAPPREPGENRPLAAPQLKRKSPVSRVLQFISVLLLLLLLALGGTVGYFYYIDGGLDLNRIVQRFPILQDYIGTLPASAPVQRIGLNIVGSTYVSNDKVGQLLVIQGHAINNFEKSRSAITVKGILLDAQGKVLYQQTAFCGNPLKDDNLKTMTFTSIEEAMNNQFGDSLSNMNVAKGAKIPFTIVFRNLPEGIANINVEVVDSKPGAS